MSTSTMNFEQARFNMIEQQIRPWDVLDQTVLDLFSAVKREDFVPKVYSELAFADLEIPLGYGATMLAPKVEARLLQALALLPTDTVLEIGTGSGFMAALLATRTTRVTSLEIVPELARMARYNLAKKPLDNIDVEICDGMRGWSAKAPYDVIVISGSVPEIPAELLAQLNTGGRMVAIVGQMPVMEAQLIVRAVDNSYTVTSLFETVAAPLVNVQQQPGYFAF